MNKFLMKLMLLIIAGIIYLITGRNRRQKEKIPDGMDILCDPPEQRYLVYGTLALKYWLHLSVYGANGFMSESAWIQPFHCYACRQRLHCLA